MGRASHGRARVATVPGESARQTARTSMPAMADIPGTGQTPAISQGKAAAFVSGQPRTLPLDAVAIHGRRAGELDVCRQRIRQAVDRGAGGVQVIAIQSHSHGRFVGLHRQPRRRSRHRCRGNFSPIDVEQVARHFFSADEQRRLAELPPSHCAACFYEQWVLKEAYLKAMGKGLADLTQSNVTDEWRVTLHHPSRITSRRRPFLKQFASNGLKRKMSNRNWRRRRRWKDPTHPVCSAQCQDRDRSLGNRTASTQVCGGMGPNDRKSAFAARRSRDVREYGCARRRSIAARTEEERADRSTPGSRL